MRMKSLFWLLLATVLSSTAHADLYVEGAFEGGGDDLAGTTAGDDISAGGGLKFAIGVQNPVNEEGTAAIRLAVGYLFDSVDAVNGEAEVDTLTFDAVYVINSGPHSFGVGGTMHMSPEYSDDIVGLSPLKVEFDDAVGLLLQYGYQVTPNMELGVRVTDLEYETGSVKFDAGSFGLYLSNGF